MMTKLGRLLLAALLAPALVHAQPVISPAPGVSASVYATDALYRKLLRNATAAQARNAWDLGAMPSATSPAAAILPTITLQTSAPSGYGNLYYSAVSGVLQTTPFSFFGGVPIPSSGTHGVVYQWSMSTATGSGYSNSNIVQTEFGGTRQLHAEADAIEFMHEGTKLFVLLNMTTTLPIRILVNDQYVSLTGSAVSANGNTWVIIDFTQGGTISAANARALRRIRIETEDATSFEWAGTPATESLRPIPTNDVVHVLWEGHSVVRGFGSSIRGNGYSQVTCKLLGWRDCRQLALEGSGILNPATVATTYDTRITDFDQYPGADVCLVDNSLNDSTPTYVSTYQAAFITHVGHIRAHQPNCLIIILGAFPGATGPSTGTGSVVALEQTIQASVGAYTTATGDTNIIFVPISTLSPTPVIFGTGTCGSTNGSGNSDIYIGGSQGTNDASNCVDTVHPTDTGHMAYARYLSGAILSALQTLRAP
ncbi:MAG: hypothetical protein P4L73_13350 [Caulobacteraceae bacterium]|nr:hypothetical protein [Caulobacteraceae bacterium]